LLNNSNDKDYKEILVRYSFYDLSDIFSLKKFNNEVLKGTYLLLSENKEYLETVKKSVN
jgi:hypothetical protein